MKTIALWLASVIVAGLLMSYYPLLLAYGIVEDEGIALTVFYFSTVVMEFLGPVLLNLDWWAVAAFVWFALQYPNPARSQPAA